MPVKEASRRQNRGILPGTVLTLEGDCTILRIISTMLREPPGVTLVLNNSIGVAGRERVASWRTVPAGVGTHSDDAVR